MIFIDEDYKKIPELKRSPIQSWFKLFGEATIVTILTSLKHVYCYDDLIIFENGEVIEKGTTKDLLDNNDSVITSKLRYFDIRVYNRILKELGIKIVKKSLVEIHKSYSKLTQADPALRNLLEKLFKQYDADHSGALEVNEIS